MRHALLSAIAALAVAGCSASHAEDRGPTVTRSFPVGAFDRVEVAGPFDVKLTTGKAVAVAASAPQKLLDETEVVVEDGKLHIRFKKKGWFGNMGGNARDKAVFTVSVPSLVEAGIAGSGMMQIDEVSGDRFKGGIAGSGDLQVGRLAVQQVEFGIAGSGTIVASGEARAAKYGIAGSGDLDASALRTTDAEAKISGSGTIQAQATGTARATINGSGDIAITGGARCQTSKNGSGDIRCS